MKYTIVVENIKCGGCANSVQKGLLLNSKVKAVKIDVETGTVAIEGADDLDMDSIKIDLRKLGYPEVNTENNLLT
ncbi:MAG: heavy-metal-associated domain-containing protein [Candidatus Margulisiibacteriota bacterium]|jgi:copper chaperone